MTMNKMNRSIVVGILFLATLLTFFHAGLAMNQPPANSGNSNNRNNYRNTDNNNNRNNRNNRNSYMNSVAGQSIPVSGSGTVPSAPVPAFNFPSDSTGASGATGMATGSTGLTGMEGLDATGISIKRKIRMENPILSDTTLMRMSEGQLQLEIEHRGLNPTSTTRSGMTRQLKKFFQSEILDMTGGELSYELERKKVVPKSEKAHRLRMQLRSHIKAPPKFPIGPAWHPSYDTPNHNDSCPVTHECSECTSKPGCGFMTNLRICLSGNHKGPHKMSLRMSFKALTNEKAISMYWTYGSCPATPCNTYRSCGSCLADKYCGWCASTQTCFEDLDGKQPLNGTCDAGWCSHPNGGAPDLFRTHTHPLNTEIRNQCEVCTKAMEKPQEMSGEEKDRVQKVLKSMDEARDAKNLERAEGNVTKVIQNEKNAEKRVKVAKKALKKALNAPVVKKEKVVKAKLNLETAQKLAVEAEATAELAGKDQREAEQVQMAAEQKADAAEMDKSTKYRETQSACDRAAKTQDPSDQKKCEESKEKYEKAQENAAKLVEESEAVAEEAILKTEKKTKVVALANVHKDNANKAALPDTPAQRSITDKIAKDALNETVSLPVQEANNNGTSNSTEDQEQRLAEEVKLGRAESEIADVNAKKVDLQMIVDSGKATNETKASLKVENAKLAMAIALKRKERAMASKNTKLSTKALLDLKVERARVYVAENEESLIKAAPAMKKFAEKKLKISKSKLNETIAERKEKLADMELRAKNVKSEAGGKADLNKLRQERASATKELAGAMETLAEENGDAKIMAQAKAEAKLAAERELMADKLGAGEVTAKAKQADLVLERTMQVGTPSEIVIAADRAHKAEQAVVRMKARMAAGGAETPEDIEHLKALKNKHLKKALKRLRKEHGFGDDDSATGGATGSATGGATGMTGNSNNTNSSSSSDDGEFNQLPDMSDLEKLDQEAQDKAIEVGISPPKHAPPTLSETAEKAGEDAMEKFIAPPPASAGAKAAGLMFSATFEISGFTCNDWTKQVEGALVISIADYIRVNKNKIAMKPQCEKEAEATELAAAYKLRRRRRLLAEIRGQKGAGVLPVDFKIKGKTRSAVRKFSTMIKRCVDNSTCPFVQTFAEDIKKLGFTPNNMVFSLVGYGQSSLGDEWAAGKLSKDNIKVLFGKAEPRRGEGLKDHIENRMTYARLLGDRVAAFSAIADAEKYDKLQLDGIKAQEEAAKADYERAAKYVQYNISDLSVEAIKTARELLVNSTKRLHEIDQIYKARNKSVDVWPSVKTVVEELEPLSAILEMARGCRIYGNGTNATATDGCKYHLNRAEEIVNASRAELIRLSGLDENGNRKRPPTQAELAAKAAQEKFLKDFKALQEKRSAKLRAIAQQKELHKNEQKFKRKRAIKKWHKNRNEEIEKKKAREYKQYLEADHVQNKLFEAVENETDTEAARNMYVAQLGIKKMQIEQREEENLENERREVSKQVENTNDTIAKEIIVRKAVKVSEEEKKAISKAKYDAEMAKNRAGAALLKAERDETMKEMALEGSEDEKNLEGLVAQDEGDDSKDSKNSRRPGISPGTGMTGATGVAALKKQKLLQEIKSGDLTDAIANAKSPELKIALEAKQRELSEEKKDAAARVNNDEQQNDTSNLDNNRGKKKETQYPRMDVQLDGAEGAHNGLGRPSLDKAGNVPSTEEYAEKMSTDDPNIVNLGA